MTHSPILSARPTRLLIVVVALSSLGLVGCRRQDVGSGAGKGESDQGGDVVDGTGNQSDADGSSDAEGQPATDGSADASGGSDDGGVDGSDGTAEPGTVDGDDAATDGSQSDGGATDGSATDGGATDVGATDGGETGATDGTDPTPGVTAEDKFPPLDPPEGLILLAKGQDVWIDKKNKQIVMDGEICLTAGQLELLVSEQGMKTHEAVISVKTKPSTVHAGLLAVGARQGSPVKYEPNYEVATGAIIDIKIKWWDSDGKLHEARGQDFVRNARTKKKLKHEWVFAGSSMWKDEFTGKVSYMADSAGDFICVSNFNSAMMDLPIESSADNQGLIYEAFTENIPPRGTKVRLILTPMAGAQEESDKTSDDPGKSDTADDGDETPAEPAPDGEADQPDKAP